jgi:excisionase family DNA binding protein
MASPPTWDEIHRVHDELINVAAAAALMGVSAMTVHRRIYAGQLQTVMFGRDIFIRRSDIRVSA